MSEATSQADAVENGYQEIHIGPKAINIPNGWDTAELEDIAREGDKSFVDGDWVESKDMVPDGPYQLIQLGNIGRGQFKGQCDKYISEEFFNEENCTLVEEGDLLISRLADPVLRTIIVPCFEKKSITAVDIVVAKIDENEWNKRYIWQLLNSKPLADAGNSLATGSTRQRISRSNMGKITIPRPPLSEQHRIAEVLSTVDEQIQQTDEIIEETRALKRGLIQGIFDVETTRNTSTQGILNDTTEDRLGNHVEVISGVHVKSELVSKDASKTPYLTGPDDFTEHGFTVSKYTDDPSKFCESGDSLVTVKGSGCGKSTFANQRAAISRQLKALRPKESLDSAFLYHWLQTKKELLSILAQGTSIPGLSTTDLTTLTVPLPKMDEQQRFGQILSTIDTRVSEERERKHHLQELKRGLMQDLLTGTVRVPDSLGP